MGASQPKGPEDVLNGQAKNVDSLIQKASNECESSIIESNCSHFLQEPIYTKVNDEDDLFRAPALVEGKVELLALVDSGYVTCILSESVESILQDHGLICNEMSKPTNKVLTGCGGNQTKPKCAYELNIDLLGCKMTVNFLVVPGQEDDMIVGSNVLSHVTQQVKNTKWYWEKISQPVKENSNDPLLSLLSNVDRWHGDKMPKRVGTVLLRQ